MAVTQEPQGSGCVRAVAGSLESQLSTTLETMNSGPGSLWSYHAMLQPGSCGNRYAVGTTECFCKLSLDTEFYEIAAEYPVLNVN